MNATILNMSRQLLELGQQYIKTGNARKGLRVLNDLLGRDDVAPSVAAEANFLIAQAHYQQSDYPHARERLAAALAEDPQNADGHRLMGRLNELDVDGSVEAARTHFARAVELAPNNPAAACQYARHLARQQQADEGLRLLRRTYAKHSDDPYVVDTFVEALCDAGRVDDAELVARQAVYRHRDDPRFVKLREQLQSRIWHYRLFGENRVPEMDESAIVPFRRMDLDEPSGATRTAAIRPAPPAAHSTPRSDESRDGTTRSFRPRIRRLGERIKSKARSTPRQADAGWQPPAVEPAIMLRGMLDLLRIGQVGDIAMSLGIDASSEAGDVRARIVERLLDPDCLAPLLERLPVTSRTLLCSLASINALVPAAVVFQNTGAEAPPPNYLQPLLRIGLVFYCRPVDTKGPRQSALHLVIPADLRAALNACFEK